MDDIDYVVLSNISEINPPTDMHRLDDNTFVSFIPMADVSESGEWINQQARPLKDVRNGYTYFQEGDILFAKITPCMENGKGAHAVNLLNGIGFGTTEFHVLRAKSRAHPRFIYHWIMNEELRRKAEARMTGSAGQRRVPASFFGEFKVPLLPFPEQRRIAEILDTIDEAIQKTEALISKLKAMKQGLLHDLFTRGLDKNGKLRDPKAHPEQFKDSPLGRIPKDWATVRLSKVCKHITKGATPTTYGHSWAKTGILFLRSECVCDGWFSIEGAEYITEAAHKSMSRSVIKGGDILVTITGNIGRVCRYPENMAEANINQHIARIRLVDTEKFNSDFVLWALQDARQKNLLELEITGLAYPQIGLAQVQAIQLPNPSINEQHLIASSLNAQDARIRAEEHHCDKLKLQKKGLMHDLLTGKARVNV